MATVTLHCGTVSTSGSSAGAVMGTGALWDDGFDGSYVESDTTQGSGALFVGFAPLDILSLPEDATVNSVTVNLRAMSFNDTDTPARVSVAVYQGTSPPFGVTFALAVNSYVPTGGWQIETGGDPAMDFTHTFDSTDFTAWDTDLVGLVTALQGGAGMYAYSLANPGHTGLTVKHRFMELSLTVDYTPGTTTGGGTTTVEPPLRLTNRDDMFSSAPSLTRSRSRQGSNRLTGYL